MTCFLLSLALRQDVRSKQPTERKKAEDVFSLLAEVRELRAAVTEKDLKEMIKQCKQINVQVQNLENESKSPQA